MQPPAKKSGLNMLIMTVAIIGMLVAGYFYFTRDRSTDILLTADLVTGASSNIEGDFLSVLEELTSVKLEGAVFSNPMFSRRDILIDHGLTLVPQTPGRSNPFAPLSVPASGNTRPAGAAQ